MRKAIELIRVSTAGQAEDDRASIPAQRSINRRTEKTYNLQIVHTIEYSDVSGAAVMMSPEIQELIRLIQNPEIHGVITKEFSRLMRPENFTDYAILQTFIDTKTVLYLPDGPIDFTTKSGLLLGTLKAVMAGQELSDIRDRIWDSKEDKRRQGKFPQSRICLPSFVAYDDERGFYYTDGIEKMREAYRLVLSGETSYFKIARKVGIEPVTLRNLLRNPIFMGWRVIDKKRDPSPSARKVRAGGRQGDRPKIKREPQDVIKVKVIDEPIVSESDWQHVQSIMDLKRKRYWRSNPDYDHRFTYNGFLLCSKCGELIYTKYRRRDYYICKGQYVKKTCDVRYMRRDRLEAQLDSLLTDYLTDTGFLRELADTIESSQERSAGFMRAERIAGEIQSLQTKRSRVLDTYIDGQISRAERDARLEKIDRDIELSNEMLERERPVATLSVDTLVSVFAPLFEFRYLSRNDKRKLLSTVVPDIRVANYDVTGIYVMAPYFSPERNHIPAASGMTLRVSVVVLLYRFSAT